MFLGLRLFLPPDEPRIYRSGPRYTLRFDKRRDIPYHCKPHKAIDALESFAVEGSNVKVPVKQLEIKTIRVRFP